VTADSATHRGVPPTTAVMASSLQTLNGTAVPVGWFGGQVEFWVQKKSNSKCCRRHMEKNSPATIHSRSRVEAPWAVRQRAEQRTVEAGSGRIRWRVPRWSRSNAAFPRSHERRRVLQPIGHQQDGLRIRAARCHQACLRSLQPVANGRTSFPDSSPAAFRSYRAQDQTSASLAAGVRSARSKSTRSGSMTLDDGAVARASKARAMHVSIRATASGPVSATRLGLVSFSTSASAPVDFDLADLTTGRQGCTRWSCALYDRKSCWA